MPGDRQLLSSWAQLSGLEPEGWGRGSEACRSKHGWERSKPSAQVPVVLGMRGGWMAGKAVSPASSCLLTPRTETELGEGRAKALFIRLPAFDVPWAQCLEWVRPVQKFATDLWSRLLGWLAGGGIATVTSFQGRNGGGWGQA